MRAWRTPPGAIEEPAGMWRRQAATIAGLPSGVEIIATQVRDRRARAAPDGLTCDQKVTYDRCAMDEMDPVFKALADPHRRHLLDRLHERDGQTLSELQSYLPLSRFGCMKHLRVLEDAGLVTSRKVGREKFHFLNPVPIQRAYDRWVEK